MYINGVMNYTGSKFKLLEQILPEMDYSKKYFVDLFTGSFVVGANLVDRYDKILANDIISDLIGIHKEIVNENIDFINNVKNLSVVCKGNQDEYNRLRESYNTNKNPEKLYALMLSCTNNMMRFNQKGQFNQTWGKRCFTDNTQNKIDEFINHIRPHKDNIKFISKNFYDVTFPHPEKVMVYIDPPYGYIKDVSGNIGKRQITEAGYSGTWASKHDILLYEYCKKLNDMGSSFMLSGVLYHNGDSTWILDKLISEGFKYKELSFNYDKVSRVDVDKKTVEVIVKNY